jgi:hypothetical protein
VLFDRATARHAKPRPRKAAKTVVATATGTALALGLDVVGATTASAHDRPFTTMLAELRGCESGGNYGINTGNGYYGAYQFNLSTWRGVGGAGYPHQNPPHVQDEMATRLYEQRGWGPWPSCSRKHGLHATTVTRPSSGHTPVGTTDRAVGQRDGIAVAGWAFDRDAAGGGTAPIEVHAYVDGRGALAMVANQERADVHRVHGTGGHHGFSAVVPAAPGRRHLCLYAVGVGNGGNASLGCRDVDVPEAQSPIGHVDTVRNTEGGVRITGWTLDKDTPAQSTQAHVYVDGRGAANVVADVPRPDVARAYGVPEARGFDVVVPHGSQVCGFAIETTGKAPNTLLACRAPA